MWNKLPTLDRMNLLKSYKKTGISYNDAVKDYNDSYQKFENGGGVKKTKVKPGEQIKYFDDPIKFKEAEQARVDSSYLYEHTEGNISRLKKLEKRYGLVKAWEKFSGELEGESLYDYQKRNKDYILNYTNALTRLDKYNNKETKPINYYHVFDGTGAEEYKKPIVTNILKQKPREPNPNPYQPGYGIEKGPEYKGQHSEYPYYDNPTGDRKWMTRENWDAQILGKGIIKKEYGGVITDSRGQYAHPGEVTRIPSNEITMNGVPYPVLAISDTGDTKMMHTGKNYKFKGSSVTEYPQINKFENGGKPNQFNQPVYNPSETVNQPRFEDPRLKYKIIEKARISGEKERQLEITQHKKKLDDYYKHATVGRNEPLTDADKIDLATQYVDQSRRQLQDKVIDYGTDIALNLLPIEAVAVGAFKGLGSTAKQMYSGAKDISTGVGNYISKMKKPTKSLIDETLGSFNYKENQEAIRSGNEWSSDWISHKRTQEKMRIDHEKSKSLLPENKGFVYTPEEYQINEIYKRAKNFKPNSKEYPLAKQYTDYFDELSGQNKYHTPMIHQGNFGVSYSHSMNPLRDRIMGESRSGRAGSYISKTLDQSKYGRESTTIHENTHEWATDLTLEKSGQKDIINENLDPVFKKLADTNSADAKALSEVDKHYAYLADPTEVHARIMELRKHYKFTPDSKITDYNVNVILSDIANDRTPIDKRFAELFENVPTSNLRDLFNKLWAVPAIGLGLNEYNKQK